MTSRSKEHLNLSTSSWTSSWIIYKYWMRLNIHIWSVSCFPPCLLFFSSSPPLLQKPFRLFRKSQGKINQQYKSTIHILLWKRTKARWGVVYRKWKRWRLWAGSQSADWIRRFLFFGERHVRWLRRPGLSWVGRGRKQSAVKNVFIRGSVVRYVHLPANAVDTALLEDATRRGKWDSRLLFFYTFFLLSRTLKGCMYILVELKRPNAGTTEAASQANKTK